MTSLLDAARIGLTGRLHPTSLTCGPSEMIAVIGPNGAGKTSLLRAIAGIEVSADQVRVRDESLFEAAPARRMRLLSFLPASRSVVWPITVRDVIALGLPTPDPARIEHLIRELDLKLLADRPISQLSTGERTRALLARSLAAEPALLLLDEPLSNLDPYWVLRTIEILRDETAANGSSALVSVHDLNQVSAFDRVILLDRGKVVADDDPHGVLASPTLSGAFKIERAELGWKIRQKT